VLAKKQWPKVRFKEKRAITVREHQAMIGNEQNPERRAFYEFCWHLGGAHSASRASNKSGCLNRIFIGWD
jgi:hypothetical protein